MIKKILIISLLVVFIASGIVVPLPAYAFTPIPISATSAVLMDSSTNQLLYAKNLNMKRAPASTTKLLTALVVLDQLDLNSVVTVPQFAEGVEPSKIHLKWGEKYRTRDLVKATLINSANDAAETLAVAAAGSSPEFANLMNKKARSLGCRDSHFVRASGLPAEDQYSTALDMALIMQAARKNQFLFDTLKTKTTTITSLDGRRIFLKNHNKMLLRGNNEVIGKTGWTRTAKHCFVGQIKLFGRKAGRPGRTSGPLCAISSDPVLELLKPGSRVRPRPQMKTKNCRWLSAGQGTTPARSMGSSARPQNLLSSSFKKLKD
jgi:D-alanyl-D-alanine carboxypeptidase (penicillin-binding protein 5/6)